MVEVTGMPGLWETMRQAIQLNEAIFVEIQRAPGGLFIALLVVFLAGLSESLGQSIILFVNRVSPPRFLFALVITAANHVVGYLLWSVTVWLVGFYLFARSVPFVAIASAVGLAYAPQLLAFFELTPFFGNSFSVILSLWSMTAILIAVRAGFGLETWEAIVMSGTGWLAIQLWRRTVGRPIYGLGRWLQRRAAGVPLKYTAADLPTLRRRPTWLENMDTWRKRMNQRDLRENLAQLAEKHDQPHV
ncbi:MAG TPA: hypothetical protein P5121_17125 [Caldilineaceae bacterium]|nr:hypothetical protein [Caldilineaceae bacterium]